MANVTTTPGFLNVNWKDFLRGLLIAVLTTPITIILQTLNAGSIVLDWTTIGIVALAGGLSYIVKNLFTPAEVVIKDADKQTVTAIKEGTAQVTVQNK